MRAFRKEPSTVSFSCGPRVLSTDSRSIPIASIASIAHCVIVTKVGGSPIRESRES
jgi:hypothetical protein